MEQEYDFINVDDHMLEHPHGMKPLRRLCLTSRSLLGSLLLPLLLLEPSWAVNEISFTFENVEIRMVLKKVSELTGTTFLFNPEEVKGKITLLSPKKVSPEEALRLLQSALALHGYTLLRKEEGTWVVPAEKAAQAETTIEVVPLTYARAAEVAETLAWIAPPGVRIVPYYPTNSLLISGPPHAVEALRGILREKGAGEQ
jgi:general secretion pathway protein D